MASKSKYKPVTPSITETQRDDMTKWLLQRLDEVIDANVERNKNFTTWRESYAVTPYNRDPIIEGGSNVRIPITRILTDAIIMRLVQSHFGVNPYVRIKPQESEDIEVAKAIENFLWYHHQMSGELNAGYLVIKDAVITGTGICKTVWDIDYKKIGGKWVHRYNAPRMVHIPTEDFIIYPAKNTSIDRAQFVGNRFWRRWDELKKAAEVGLYNDDWLEELREQTSGSENVVDSEDNRVGVKEVGIDWKDIDYELFELIVAYDLDDDGLDEDYLVTIDYTTRTIIRLQEYPAQFGERWYHAYIPIPVSNSFYGESMVKLVADIDEEITTRHNQRLDNRTLVNIPMFTVVEGSPALNDDISVYPGKMWKVQEHDDIRPLVQIPPLRDTLEDENQLMYYAQNVIGVSELNLGQVPRGTQTAYEIEASLAEGSIRIRLQVSLGVEWLKRVAWHEIGLLKQFLPNDQFERVTEHPNYLEDMEWEDLWNKYDIEPVGNTTTSNAELERQKLIFVREAMKNDPLMFDLDPMTGQMVPKKGWYELNKLFLIAHGVDAYQLIIGDPPEKGGAQAVTQGQLPTMNQVSGEQPDIESLMQAAGANPDAMPVTPGAV